jgi:hypothetical protein
VIDLVVLLSLAGVLAAVGIRVGMLLAPRLDRMIEKPDEGADEPAPDGDSADQRGDTEHR